MREHVRWLLRKLPQMGIKKKVGPGKRDARKRQKTLPLNRSFISIFSTEFTLQG